jgi:hypothetical protein
VGLFLFGLFWMSSADAGPVRLDDVLPNQTSGVIEAGVGCKIIGGSLVCGRDGGGLRDRKILPRKRKQTTPVQKKPVQTKPAAKKTSPTKSSTPSGAKSKSTAGSSSTDVPAQEPADADQESGKAEAEQPATAEDAPDAPQDETPPPAPSQKPETPAPAATAPASESSTEIPDDIRDAACGAGACACPAGSAYHSEACKAALPACCSAKVSAEGKPHPAISRCGADQNKAMSAVVSSAMEKKLTLGPVRCTNQ